MRLSDLLKNISFEECFSEILKYAPETETMRETFLRIFDFLHSLPSIVKLRTYVEAHDHLYLGDKIYYIRLYAYPKEFPIIRQFPLLNETVEPIYDIRYFREVEPLISKQSIMSRLLWDLVGINQFNKTPTPADRRDKKVIERFYEISPFNISPDRGAFRAECSLDDYMWRNEKGTAFYLLYSPGYESQIEKLSEFINQKMRDPTIILEKNAIRGIALKCDFLA